MKYKQLLKEIEFMKVLSASFITRIGDGIDTVAFSWLVYEITGSTVLVAIIYGVNMIPNLILATFAGGLSKYVGEKTIMWIADLGRFLCVCLIAILYMNEWLMIWHLFVITFMNSVLETLRAPASSSIFPKLLDKEKREHGLALQETLTNAANLMGYAVGPACIGLFGLGGAIGIDALSFLLCAFIIMSMKKVNADTNEVITMKGYLEDIKEGFIYCCRDKLMLGISLFSVFANMAVVPLNVFEAPYVKDYLHMGSEGVAMMGVSTIIGMMLIAPFLPKIKNKTANHKMLIYGSLFSGIFYTTIFLLPKYTMLIRYMGIIVSMAGMGACIAILNFPVNITVYNRVPQEYLSRFMAVLRSFSMGAIPLGAFIAGAISTFISIDMIILGSGILLMFSSILLVKFKKIRELDQY